MSSKVDSVDRCLYIY